MNRNDLAWGLAIGGLGLAILSFPVAVVAGLMSKGRHCAPQGLVTEFRKFAAGIECPRVWERLEGFARYQRLETIRLKNTTVDVSLGPEEWEKLGKPATKVVHPANAQ
jgi:hypothetical protein